VRFQEALFARQIIFVAGVAEAKSKGRGEECISQNLRILQSRNGTQTILFFANSQRKERKGYISIPGRGRACRPALDCRFGDLLCSQWHRPDRAEQETRAAHLPPITTTSTTSIRIEGSANPISR
jgi:hypothetical protein